MLFFFFVLLKLLLLLMDLSQPKSCNYQEVLSHQWFIPKNYIQYSSIINICDLNNDLNLS